MKLRNCREYVLICCILMLFFGILISGCVENPAKAPETMINTTTSPNATGDPRISSNNSSVLFNVTGTGTPDLSMKELNVTSNLDADWKAFRIINMDLTTRYLSLDLSKSDDINYLRYSLLPETSGNIENIRSDLETIQPVTPDQENETDTLMSMTNYTLLKYQTLSEMLHATQYANMHDPADLKSEIRNARLTVMDALDIVNAKDLTSYPSMYRDQIAADKAELTDMMSQIDTYTRSVYLTPTD